MDLCLASVTVCYDTSDYIVHVIVQRNTVPSIHVAQINTNFTIYRSFPCAFCHCSYLTETVRDYHERSMHPDEWEANQRMYDAVKVQAPAPLCIIILSLKLQANQVCFL